MCIIGEMQLAGLHTRKHFGNEYIYHSGHTISQNVAACIYTGGNIASPKALFITYKFTFHSSRGNMGLNMGNEST